MSKFITYDKSELPESASVREYLNGKTYNFTWKIRFSLQLDAESVNNTTMFVTGSDGHIINCKIVYNAVENVIEIYPLEQYEPKSQYTLTITTRVKSVVGSHLSQDVHFPFSID